MRSVVRTHRFEAELQDLIPHTQTADEFIEAAEFVLARDPLAGCEANRANQIWYMPMVPLGDVQFAIYYTFDAENVVFLTLAPIS